jgi:hypothetical protein
VSLFMLFPLLTDPGIGREAALLRLQYPFHY